MNPIARFTTMMTPKCSGETPTLTITGSSMGARITMAAKASMNVPTMSRSTLISRSTMTLLSVKPRMPRAIVPGTSSRVIMLPKSVAMAISRMMTEDVSQASMQACHRPFKFISRYRKSPTIRP